jgi:hypothetical protein
MQILAISISPSNLQISIKKMTPLKMPSAFLHTVAFDSPNLHLSLPLQDPGRSSGCH